MKIKVTDDYLQFDTDFEYMVFGFYPTCIKIIPYGDSQKMRDIEVFQNENGIVYNSNLIKLLALRGITNTQLKAIGPIMRKDIFYYLLIEKECIYPEAEQDILAKCKPLYEIKIKSII